MVEELSQDNLAEIVAANKTVVVQYLQDGVVIVKS